MVYLPGLEKAIDPDLYAIGTEALLMDRDMVQLQLCRNIRELTEELKKSRSDREPPPLFLVPLQE